MPSSYLGSPESRSKALRDRRVSFISPGYPEELLSGSSSSAFAVPAHVKHKHHHRHHQSHASTSQPANKSSRRARVEDADDSEDDSDEEPKAGASKDKGKGKENPANQSAVPVGQAFPQPPAHAAGYNTLINPALGPNGVFTHQYAPQGYDNNIQAFPFYQQGYYPVNNQTYASATMDSYSGATGLSFVPPVPDTTYGPMVHTYVPRHDPPGVGVGGYTQYPGGFPGQAYPVATTTAPMMPAFNQPTYIQQPQMVYCGGGGGGGGCGVPPALMMTPGDYPGGGYPGMVHPEPALGIGQTPSEVLQEQLEFAYTNNMDEPQDFKPADDDPSRFYWVRELDGNWTQRSRATVDHIGCRWYITDSGVFYAVRLPN